MIKTNSLPEYQTK